jgi:hypothetical protein
VRRSNLERNTTEVEIGGQKAPARLGIVNTCHANGDLEVGTWGFWRFLYGAARSGRLGLDFISSIRTTSVPAHSNIFTVSDF